MKKAIISAVAILGLTGSIAIAAPATEGSANGGRHGRGHHGKGHGHRGGERLAEKLNLTDAQKSQWRAEQKAFRLNNATFLEQMRQTSQELRAARKAGDTARLDALKGTMTAQRTQFKQLREAQDRKFASMLTAEQRARYDTLKAERAARQAERGDRQRQRDNDQR